MDIVDAFTWGIVGAVTFLAFVGAVIRLADCIARYVYGGEEDKNIEIYEPLNGSWRKTKRS